jgi:N-acetylornithine carbamoyltransferase
MTSAPPPLRHFLTTEHWSRDELQAMLDRALEFKRPGARINDRLKGKAIALVFFNPSLRTRTSFEVGAWQMGGHAVVLEPGKGAWPIAFDEVGTGVPMLGEEEEHVKEAARVLSRFCDLIAVRAFPKFVDWKVDREDRVIRAFAKHATVPVINMETIVHPCQELALMLAIEERMGAGANDGPAGSLRRDFHGRKFLLTWTYHPKGLNTAVANSAALISSKFGFDVTLLCPTPEYVLDERYMEAARRQAKAAGGSFRVTHDINDGYAGADVVYAKSWGALPYFGEWEREKPIRDQFKHFIVDEKKMALTNDGLFSHCLPMRRNVKATDGVADAPYSMIIDEAENRLHVQKAIMDRLINGA